MIKNKSYVKLLLIIVFFINILSCSKNYQYINDEASFFSKSEKERLSDKIKTIKNETTAEIIIQTIESLNGKSIKQYALEIGNTNKIGIAGINNGIIILLSKNEKAIQILNGYGIEWIISDDITKSIVNEAIKHFKDGNYFKGLYSSLDIIEKYLTSYDWTIYDDRFPKIDESLNKKIVSFKADNSDIINYKTVIDTSIQFSDKSYIILKTKDNNEYKLYYTKYMNEYIKDIMSKPNITIYSRISDYENRRLELLGIKK